VITGLIKVAAGLWRKRGIYAWNAWKLWAKGNEEAA
jgi:hypothetical protein